MRWRRARATARAAGASPTRLCGLQAVLSVCVCVCFVLGLHHNSHAMSEKKDPSSRSCPRSWRTSRAMRIRGGCGRYRRLLPGAASRGARRGRLEGRAMRRWESVFGVGGENSLARRGGHRSRTGRRSWGRRGGLEQREEAPSPRGKLCWRPIVEESFGAGQSYLGHRASHLELECTCFREVVSPSGPMFFGPRSMSFCVERL